MSRLLKALPLTFALAALSIFSASCGSSNAPAQIRFVHAIQDAGALDIAVTGPNTASTPEFTHVSFLGVQPTQPGYTSVPSGRDSIAAVSTGTTTPVFSATATLGANGHYTLVATGLSQTPPPIGPTVVLLEISDNIPTPPSGDVEFRVIHASPSGPDGKGGAVDVYIELNPNTGPGFPIAIQGLTYTQASKYVTFTFNPNNATPPPGFTAYVTEPGSTTPIFSYPLNPSAAGAVRTLVLTDAPTGNAMNSTFLELSDLN